MNHTTDLNFFNWIKKKVDSLYMTLKNIICSELKITWTYSFRHCQRGRFSKASSNQCQKLHVADIFFPILRLVTCDRSVVFSGYSGFLHKNSDRHNITEILLKVALNIIIPRPPFQDEMRNLRR